MSLIKQGGTARRNRASNPTKRVKPGDNPNDPANVAPKGKRGKAKPKKPAPPKERPLGPADMVEPSHPLHGAFVAWLQRKSRELKLDNPLPVTKRQARKFLAAHSQYRAVMVPVEKAA